jgi:hypothetical protein
MAGHGVAGAKVPDWRIAMTEMTDMAKAWSAVVAEKNAEVVRLRAQRDQLVAALKEIDGIAAVGAAAEMQEIARAAVAAAGG